MSTVAFERGNSLENLGTFGFGFSQASPIRLVDKNDVGNMHVFADLPPNTTTIQGVPVSVYAARISDPRENKKDSKSKVEPGFLFFKRGTSSGTDTVDVRSFIHSNTANATFTHPSHLLTLWQAHTKWNR